jgi:Matrixin
MNSKNKFYLFFFLLSFSCNTVEGTYPVLFSCNNVLGSCGNAVDVPYCTLGYKLGDSNPYEPRGAGISGPMIKANLISYKFKVAGIVMRTITQDNAVSLQFSENEKSEIRTAISEWSSVADINFVEKADNEATDITIISAFIPVGSNGGGQGSVCGLGHPAFNLEPCKQLAGYLVINPKCNLVFPIALHELGHVLGLGHVASENVMHPDRLYSINHLQNGDILGIQSIYGSK